MEGDKEVGFTRFNIKEGDPRYSRRWGRPSRVAACQESDNRSKEEETGTEEMPLGTTGVSNEKREPVVTQKGPRGSGLFRDPDEEINLGDTEGEEQEDAEATIDCSRLPSSRGAAEQEIEQLSEEESVVIDLVSPIKIQQKQNPPDVNRSKVQTVCHLLYGDEDDEIEILEEDEADLTEHEYGDSEGEEGSDKSWNTFEETTVGEDGPNYSPEGEEDVIANSEVCDTNVFSSPSKAADPTLTASLNNQTSSPITLAETEAETELSKQTVTASQETKEPDSSSETDNIADHDKDKTDIEGCSQQSSPVLNTDALPISSMDTSDDPVIVFVSEGSGNSANASNTLCVSRSESEFAPIREIESTPIRSTLLSDNLPPLLKYTDMISANASNALCVPRSESESAPVREIVATANLSNLPLDNLPPLLKYKDIYSATASNALSVPRSESASPVREIKSTPIRSNLPSDDLLPPPKVQDGNSLDASISNALSVPRSDSETSPVREIVSTPNLSTLPSDNLPPPPKAKDYHCQECGYGEDKMNETEVYIKKRGSNEAVHPPPPDDGSPDYYNMTQEDWESHCYVDSDEDYYFCGICETTMSYGSLKDVEEHFYTKHDVDRKYCCVEVDVSSDEDDRDLLAKLPQEVRRYEAKLGYPIPNRGNNSSDEDNWFDVEVTDDEESESDNDNDPDDPEWTGVACDKAIPKLKKKLKRLKKKKKSGVKGTLPSSQKPREKPNKHPGIGLSGFDPLKGIPTQKKSRGRPRKGALAVPSES